ncbi:peptide/nickel transport system ATP-binding protein [Austwickia chelonae]|uniref:Putative ABC transporter ATP-binding protein n=1 Tax=Austwickia chelonae NBRC 105200 TaxID=1184607 RepID=K6UNZ9_9MICO|nr:ABC transporter ATP-binding protein [Austwickia chelonae]GAB79391.1 putative ABC transporter ATP-binding protein [Austwickia chelonae NBRC 105200]SEW43606.1 peptide/nickel transport system ATP-binding protein [Austwickia chelonae]
MNKQVAHIRDLRVRFGDQEILHGVNLELSAGRRLGLLGESGSGKTLTGRALLGLLPTHATATGSILLHGKEMLGAPEHQWRQQRGHTVGLIAQDPRTALNPLVRIGDQVAEPLRARGHGRTEARERALELLEQVRLPDARRLARRHPGSLSGGQRQRVGIAMALAAGPDLLIADEPTSALDVCVQAEILPLLAEISQDRALLFITHDIAVASAICDDLVVLRAGEIVDSGPLHRVLHQPAHPYVTELLDASRATALPATATPPPVAVHAEFAGGRR